MTHLALSPTHQYPELEHPLDGRYQVIQIFSEKKWQRTYLAQDLRRPSQPECLIHHLRVIPEIPDYLAFVRHLLTQEASSLEAVGKHPQLPELLACFENEAGFYVVYEWIPGTLLQAELATGQPWSEEQVVEFLLQTLEPLAQVHDKGILHGNLKPDTVIRRLSDRQLTLVNFACVEALQLSVMAMHDLTTPLEITGTTGYEAPEQMQGLPGLASDVYALGMIAIHALTAIHPIQFGIDVATGETQWQPFHPATQQPHSQALVHILTQMVHFDPAQRYPSAKEALQALRFLNHGICASATDRPIIQGTVSPAASPSVRAMPSPQKNPPPSQPLQQFLRQTLPTKVLPAGIAASLTAALAVGGQTLLTSPQWANLDGRLLDEATRQYQAGQLQRALVLAGRISSDSPTYARAQTAIAHWKREWQMAQAQFAQAQQAQIRQQWPAIVQIARKLPPMPYWQKQMAPLLKQAINQLEQVGQKQLQQAYRQAGQRNFTEAIAALKQIPDGTAVSLIAQQKLAEYQEKQNILATSRLQQAFTLAYMGDFEGAIPFLNQVPVNTPMHPIAQRKLQEYQQKKQIRDQLLVAYRNQPNLSVVVANTPTLPESIASATPFAEGPTKISRYTTAFNREGDYWLGKAKEQAKSGDFTAAMLSLQKVPAGTIAYGESREKLLLYTRQQEQQTVRARAKTPVEAEPSQIDWNPGEQMIEVPAIQQWSTPEPTEVSQPCILSIR